MNVFVAGATGVVGAAEIMARSPRVSNRVFKEASGWAPQLPTIREGLPAVVAELQARDQTRA